MSVITSKQDRATEIEALGAKPLVGTMQDVDFLSNAFSGADIVYLMETMEATNGVFNADIDLVGAITQIGENYKAAVLKSGVKKIVHLSSIGAHMAEGNGVLKFHYNVEQILRSLPEDVAVKFMRPVGFYINMFGFMRTIHANGTIVSNYGGDTKHPWVSPIDIAAAIAEEMELPFAGRTVRYVVSEEISPNEIARILGDAIGKELKWVEISDEEMLQGMLAAGMNPEVAKGFVEMQASQRSGVVYEDYQANRPEMGRVKVKDFAQQFAQVYKSQQL